jgi:glutathione peroxidase
MIRLSLVSLLLAACSSDDGASGKADAALRDQTVATDASADGIVLPDQSVAAPDVGFVCSPPAKAGELYALSASTGVTDVSMCEFRGQVLMIANIAAKCGFTPQLGALAQLHTKYAAQGFTVLGFYSDQFNQSGTEDEHKSCEASYGVTFPTFPDVAVNPPGEHPIFTWLKAQPGGAGAVKWNFEKFLVSHDGELLGRWATGVAPDATEVTGALEAALKAAP